MRTYLLLIFLMSTYLFAGEVRVLGIAQDAGYPQAACQKACCEKVLQGKMPRRLPTALALVGNDGQRWLFEATPAITEQLAVLDKAIGHKAPSGIFLTHAHIGHYTGLMYLGREVMGAQAMPVYVMPRMAHFLRTNGPWQQLVKLKNIDLVPLHNQVPTKLTDDLLVTPILVPHRDEYSETVGFIIRGKAKSLLFIPDINKWDAWSTRVETVIEKVDYALLDATFFDNGEIPNRDMSEIPHPFVVESMTRFAPLPKAEKDKIIFIHLNHTNPALDPASKEAARVRDAGFKVAYEGMALSLD